MRLSFFILILIPTVGVCQATLGIKAGLNISDVVMTNYINPDVESDLGLKLGLHAGVFLSGDITESLGLSGELLYSDKGVNGGSNVHLHYITLPLMIEYRLTDHISAELGPEPGYLFSATSRYGNAANTYSNKLDLALDGGFRLDTHKMVFGIRYCVGLLSVREPVEVVGPSGPEKIKYQNRVLQLSMGYKLAAVK